MAGAIGGGMLAAAVSIVLIGVVFAAVYHLELVVWTILGSDPVARTYTGRPSFVGEAFVQLVGRLQSPIVLEVHHIWAEGDTVIVRFDGEATTTSGTPNRNQFVWIFEMENGAVVRAEAFLDLVAYREVVENNEPKAD